MSLWKLSNIMIEEKNKASELVYQFYHRIEHKLSEEYSKFDWDISKELALLTVNELIKYSNEPSYWERVKAEINNL